MNLKPYLISILLLVFAGHFNPSTPAGAGTDPSHRNLYASVTSVLHKMKQNTLLVDVRSHQAYEKVNIPDSINVPLFAVKTKAFLKGRSLVLVNEGYNRRQLEVECGKLRAAGFDVSILMGGLNAWREKGLKFRGDLFAVRAFAEVSPRDFYGEKDGPDHAVIDISRIQSPESQRLVPGALHIHIPLTGHETPDDPFNSAGLQELAGKQKRTPHLSLLVVNEEGRNYEAIEKILKKNGLRAVFYLTGGWSGYRRYLQGLARSRIPRDSRIKTVVRCNECGDKGQFKVQGSKLIKTQNPELRTHNP